MSEVKETKRYAKSSLADAVSVRTGLPRTQVTEIINNYLSYSKFMVTKLSIFNFLGIMQFTNKSSGYGQYTTYAYQIGEVARETGADKTKVESVLQEYRSLVIDLLKTGTPVTISGLILTKPKNDGKSIALRRSSTLDSNIRVSLNPWFKAEINNERV